jgi:tetratricopeptide (TPR) repeat protein
VAVVDPQLALRNAAQEALAARDWPRLRAVAQQLTTVLPQDAQAHFLAGIAALELRQAVDAQASLLRAVTLTPASQAGERATRLAQLARARSLLGDANAAAELALQALALQPADALTLDTLGVVLSRANRHADAARAFGVATRLHPRQPAFHFNLGAALEFTGDFDGAEAAFEAALAIEPMHWRSHHALAQLRRATPERHHLQRLQGLLPQATEPASALLLRHALAKELEDLGRYEEALAELQAGKAPVRAQLRYDFSQDAALFAALEQAFSAPQPQDQALGDATEEPIFVVGMPRTGTTLVERILSSHPQVSSAGELQNFGLVLKRASGTRTPRVLDAETIAAARQLDLSAVGAQYLRSTRPATGHRAHFVDKLPHNFLYLGFIARALPRARIVCLRRDALDTCLSNYRQLFAIGQSYYGYALDLLDCGRYYLAFERLMAFWEARLPGRVHRVDYEILVAEPERQVRALLDHCGLEWSEHCLGFERNQAPVSTASAVQVRSPLYRSAIGRWRHYEPQLGALKALLGQRTGPE